MTSLRSKQKSYNKGSLLLEFISKYDVSIDFHFVVVSKQRLLKNANMDYALVRCRSTLLYFVVVWFFRQGKYLLSAINVLRNWEVNLSSGPPYPVLSSCTKLKSIGDMRKSLLCKSVYLRTRVVVLLTNRNDIVNVLVANQPIRIVKTTQCI